MKTETISSTGIYIVQKRSGAYFVAEIPGRGKVYYHRLVMERHLGRILGEHEHVHHIDGDTMNNDLDNLLLTDRDTHTKIHARERRHAAQMA